MTNPNANIPVANQDPSKRIGGANHDPHELTVQQEAYLLHILHVEALRKKLETEAGQLRERQEKIKFIHEIMQHINNYMDGNGGLNIGANSDLQEMLQDAKDLGIKLPEGDKTVFNAHECKRLIDNLDYAIQDWEKEDTMQLRKMQNLYTESEQSILIAKTTATSMDKPTRAMISGIHGR
ncbi:MAG: hypothetical protein H0W88_12095 [Parachlamydiaceae bacterium]|nr:hypothetical protein [Parachlamydiaceae bacterium]